MGEWVRRLLKISKLISRQWICRLYGSINPITAEVNPCKKKIYVFTIVPHYTVVIYAHKRSYSLSQNCWDTFVSPCPLNVGVQGLVTEPR